MANPAAITTYSELQDAIAEYLLNEDLQTNDAPLFISLAESDFNDELLVRQMKSEQTGNFVVGVTEITLPSDYIETLDFYYTRSSAKTARPSKVTPQWLSTNGQDTVNAGLPAWYAIVGDVIRMYPKPDSAYAYTFEYYAKIPALSALAPSNWLLTSNPIIYLSRALAHAFAFFENDNRAAFWNNVYEKQKMSLQNADTRARYRPYFRVRPDGPSDTVWRR